MERSGFRWVELWLQSIQWHSRLEQCIQNKLNIFAGNASEYLRLLTLGVELLVYEAELKHGIPLTKPLFAGNASEYLRLLSLSELSY